MQTLYRNKYVLTTSKLTDWRFLEPKIPTVMFRKCSAKLKLLAQSWWGPWAGNQHTLRLYPQSRPKHSALCGNLTAASCVINHRLLKRCRFRHTDSSRWIKLETIGAMSEATAEGNAHYLDPKTSETSESSSWIKIHSQLKDPQFNDREKKCCYSKTLLL